MSAEIKPHAYGSFNHRENKNVFTISDSSHQSRTTYTPYIAPYIVRPTVYYDTTPTPRPPSQPSSAPTTTPGTPQSTSIGKILAVTAVIVICIIAITVTLSLIPLTSTNIIVTILTTLVLGIVLLTLLYCYESKCAQTSQPPTISTSKDKPTIINGKLFPRQQQNSSNMTYQPIPKDNPVVSFSGKGHVLGKN